MTVVDLNRYNSMLRKIIELLHRLYDVNECELKMDIITCCQESLICIGEELEGKTNRCDIENINNTKVITELEDLCENLYQYSLSFDKGIIDELESKVLDIIRILEEFDRTYRVVFIPYKASMWDSLESIWKEFVKDERIETDVVVIPYYEANRINNQWEEHCDKDLFPQYVEVVNYEGYDLNFKKPDYIFTHNPFDKYNNVTSVHPFFFSDELKKNCTKLIYVPYYVNPGYLSDDYNKLPLLWKADYLVFQSEGMKESCKDFPYYDKVLPFGSPKFDKVIEYTNGNVSLPLEWNIDFGTKKKLLLNTTIADFLTNSNEILAKLKCFFVAISRRTDVAIIWRPHPLLEATIKAMRPELYTEYIELILYFKKLEIGILDNTEDSAKAVALCDAYIGSGYSALVALCMVADKVVFSFDSSRVYDDCVANDRKRLKPYEAFSKRERDYFKCIESENYLFEDFVDDLTNNRFNEVLDRQRMEEKDINSSPDGTCGKKVYQFLISELFMQ